MRWSLRFFRSCSSSSFIFTWAFLPVIEQKVIACDTAQDHALKPVQVVETVTSGFGNGGEHRVAGIFLHHAQQLTQGNDEILAALLFESGEIAGQFRCGRNDPLFFRMRIGALDALAAGWTGRGQSDALL